MAVQAPAVVQHTCRLEEAETLHGQDRPDPEFPLNGSKISRSGLDILRSIVLFGHDNSGTGFTRKSDLQKTGNGKSRPVCRHTLAILHLLLFFLPWSVTHTFFHDYSFIGLGILLILHDITGRGNDLQSPKFSLLPLQNIQFVNFGGDGPTNLDPR
jgi:hypothetical protein